MHGKELSEVKYSLEAVKVETQRKRSIQNDFKIDNFPNLPI